jgi:hypothetical protein
LLFHHQLNQIINMLRAILLSTLAVITVGSNIRASTAPRFLATMDEPIAADSHHDFDKDYKTVEEQSAEYAKHNYEFVSDIHTTKQELVQLLIKMRGEMKKHFGHLEETVRKRINGIFKVACASAETAEGTGSEAEGCWVAMKVECQVYDVKEFVHTHRRKLVAFIRQHLGGLQGKFDKYLEERGLGCHDHQHVTPCESEMDCKCNAKLEIDGILGMHIQQGDNHILAKDGDKSVACTDPTGAKCTPITSDCSERNRGKTQDEVWAMTLEDSCPSFTDCLKTSPDCAVDHDGSDPGCGNVAGDHTCLGSAPGYNKQDDGCVIEHLGMQGINSYYGGTEAHIGRVGELLDGAFECAIKALDENKVSCNKADRDAHQDHCVNGACDCACICGGHQTSETIDTCAQTHTYTGAFPIAGNSATCGNAEWKKSNACPARPIPAAEVA